MFYLATRKQVLLSGGAIPGHAGSNDLAGRSTALAPPCLLLCFASVMVWTENKNFTISDRWPLYLFYFDNETIGGLCVLRATTEKILPTFLRDKVHPGDLAQGCSDLEMTWLLCCAGAATGVNVTLEWHSTRHTHISHNWTNPTRNVNIPCGYVLIS